MILSVLTSNKAVFWEIKLWIFKKKKSNHLLPCGVAQQLRNCQTLWTTLLHGDGPEMVSC